MVAEPSTEEPVGRTELARDVEAISEERVRFSGAVGTGQKVVVMLITVVDVSTTVELGGQLVTDAAHLVIVYVDVAYTTEVMTEST